MDSTSDHEITHPITVILDEPASYHAWSQNMIVFLKRRRLWHYVTGDIPKPVPGSVTDSDSSDGDSVADAVVKLMILKHVLRNGKASNAGSFPGSLTPLCLPLAVSFLDWKQVKRPYLSWPLGTTNSSKLRAKSIPRDALFPPFLVRCSRH